ncbi:MAG: nuclear transport factor 2 family protein [Ignavibacteriaceae bacterium]
MSEEEVRKVSQQFYNALTDMANGIAGKMDGIWLHDKSVTAMHPIDGRDIGWTAVSNSFDQVAGLASGGKVELKDRLIHVLGDTAYEIGTETGEFKLAGNDVKIGQRVTNIYHLKDGQWKMIHHHADTSAAMLDVLSKLQSSTE